jgi:hypothetical protein
LVALDLSTPRLGEVWVSLHALGGLCRCRFRATRKETLRLIQAGASDLERGLRDAGYQGAKVEAERWDGDRLSQLAGWMRPLLGIDLRG